MIDRYSKALRSAHRPALIVGYALLAVSVIALVFYLRHADTPWENGVEARLAAGRNVKAIHHVVSGLWYGSWINLVVCALLALAMPIITQPLARFPRTKAGVSPRSRAAFIIAAVAAVGLAASLCAPRLASSLWGDEEYTLRRSIIGEYERNADDVPELRKATWVDTLWLYKKPNNHILNSVLSRLSHETFFAQTQDPKHLHFSEPILRMPAFLAALGAIAATGYALACLGFLRAGILSMFLLALHPWFIRYATETRGYAFVFLFAPLALAFLIKAIRRGRWRYWIGYCLCEFLMFIAFPGTFYLLVAMNLSGLLLALSARGGWTNRRIQLGRFLVANVASAMLVVQLMAPCYAQLKAYFAGNRARGVQGLDWVGDNLSYLASGMPWQVWEAGNPLCHALAQRPVLGGILLTLVAAALIAGVVRLFTASLQSRYLIAYFVLPWALLYFGSNLKGHLLYHWYSSTVLAPILMVVALGIEWVACAEIWRGRRNLPWLGASAAFIALFVAVVRPQIVSLRGHSVEPLRESVSMTRNVLNPTRPDIDEVLTVGFNQPSRGYDPTMYFIRGSDPSSLEKFQGLLAKSKSENKPLYVNLAMRALARLNFPELMRIIDDPLQFERLDPFWGMSENTTRYVYKYIGGNR